MNITVKQRPFSLGRYIAAWAVHIFTASTAVLALYTLLAIFHHKFTLALWLMGAATLIDAVDGTFARMVDVKSVLPRIDGALLDNIVDYLNYVITPAFFLMIHPHMLAVEWRGFIPSMIALVSTYQFTQSDAKTEDHFFKGFPSYWNLTVIYLYIFSTSATFNVVLLPILAIFVFIPIKYVYPSRMDYLTEMAWLRKAMLTATILYGVATAGLLWSYPDRNILLVIYALGYTLVYIGFSLLRTFVPIIIKQKNKLMD